MLYIILKVWINYFYKVLKIFNVYKILKQTKNVKWSYLFIDFWKQSKNYVIKKKIFYLKSTSNKFKKFVHIYS